MIGTPTPDPVADGAREWIDLLNRQDALVRSWQEAEHELFKRARSLKISLSEAAQGDSPEAKSMRSLSRRIKLADRELARAAANLAAMQSTSIAGSIAKLEMALRMRGTSLDDEPAWTLVSRAAAHLRQLMP